MNDTLPMIVMDLKKLIQKRKNLTSLGVVSGYGECWASSVSEIIQCEREAKEMANTDLLAQAKKLGADIVHLTLNRAAGVMVSIHKMEGVAYKFQL